MNHTTKTTTRLGTTATVAITTVTLALLATAAIVVSMMPTIVQRQAKLYRNKEPLIKLEYSL